MTMTVEQSLTSFEFWSGAETNATYFSTEELERLDEWFDEYNHDSGKILSETDINDMFWFEPHNLLEILGYEDGQAEWEKRTAEG